MTRDALIITCEHGGNEVPAAYAPLFAGHEALLPTHRGWDAGALVALGGNVGIKLDSWFAIFALVAAALGTDGHHGN